ncbi:MAG: hypothetical protein IJ293_01925 [Treponema sp.]|nr:hypothetical protein [Treponema sp.]
MTQDSLTLAWKYLRRRKFYTAIKLLENKRDIYEDNFEYYLLLGISCLYVGDIGTASSYFQKARHIKLTDVRLLLGQAAIFLRRGDTERALQYYVDIKNMDPNNQVALDAIEFIRTRGDYDTICRWVDSGRMEQFYPPLGVNPQKVARILIPLCAGVLGCVLTLILLPKNNYATGERGDLSSLVLNSEEKSNAQETDLSSQSMKYILSNSEITKSYSDALKYYQVHRDNAVQVEINRILNSNAALSIKQKAQILMNYLTVPTFDTISDVPLFSEVEKESSLYLDCWVVWSGRISDAIQNEDGSYSCRLLVGYDSMVKVDGIIDVKFAENPNIVPEQPLKILGQIKAEDNKIYLKGRAVYQSVHDSLK